ncbi:MAG: hypothetical protein M1824_005950 [Vezdaea acicularis]|nr:MAG: hypothetical protein M1824_005950 [Vezdaea acicularis]
MEKEEKWVVRYPLPSVHNPREKLESEIATMNYVQAKTTIPVPRIHGYRLGEDDCNTVPGQNYLLMDFVPGERWHGKNLPNLSQEVSTRFYTQLASILAQLRRQEFERIGSLTLDSKKEGWKLEKPPLSMDLNDQLIRNQRSSGTLEQTFESAPEYIWALYELLYTGFKKQRNSVFDRKDAERKVYALEDFRNILSHWINTKYSNGPFVLMHGDLRPSNLVVDADYNILAVLDWEWSRTVPIQLFIPPTWLTGYDADIIARPGYQAGLMLQHFKLGMAITKSRKANVGLEILEREWPCIDEASILIASALLRNFTFYGIYFDGLSRLYSPKQTEELYTNFFQDPERKHLVKLVEEKP